MQHKMNPKCYYCIPPSITKYTTNIHGLFYTFSSDPIVVLFRDIIIVIVEDVFRNASRSTEEAGATGA